MAICSSLLAALVFLQMPDAADRSDPQVPADSLVRSFPGEADAVRRIVNTRKDWAADLDICPASLMPSGETKDHLIRNTCKSPELAICFSSCQGGDVSSCYWLGRVLEVAWGNQPQSDALLQHACKLGVMSACTRRALDIANRNPESPVEQDCAVQTWRKTCALEDPWGCAYHAEHLLRQPPAGLDRAQLDRAIAGACSYGPEEPACVHVKQLEQPAPQ